MLYEVITYNAYVWYGAGLYPQLWAMLLLLPALGATRRALDTGRGGLLATALLAATALSHLLIGYVANECGDDFDTLCAGVAAGEGRLLQCLENT